MLTAFFDANKDPGPLGEEARKLMYQEFLQHFVWNKDGKKKWTLRMQGFGLGRMYFVAPNAGERFYLRTLLSVIKGPTSFDDLHTYGRPDPWPTFCEACIARGLLEDDSEWRQCLQEASVMQTGYCLCQLFITLLTFCEPAQPERLWQEFHHGICDDLEYRLRVAGFQNPTEEQIYDYGLFLLDNLLHESGRSLKEWPTMPQPQHNWQNHFTNPLIAEQLNYNPEDE